MIQDYFLFYVLWRPFKHAISSVLKQGTSRLRGNIYTLMKKVLKLHFSVLYEEIFVKNF